MNPMSLEQLRDAVAGGAAAIRSRVRLEPAGGPADKVFPPTYVKDGKAETKYAFEARRIEGQEVQTVLLDSVASQANRMELALLQGWRRKELRFPLVAVDFTKEEGLEDLAQITALEAPHRIADALLRDSVMQDRPFRYTDVGRAFTDARVDHATGMYRYCPTAILFGIWDSTGPKGGLGAKFQRCIASEIIGIDAVAGRKTASRIDPTGIERKAGPVFEHPDPEQRWTIDEEEAKKQKGKPVQLGKGTDKGRPAGINHGNIPPSIDSEAGGVTIDHAEQTAVFSLAALRRVRFTSDADGKQLPSESAREANLAARCALAALGLAAMVYQREDDYDLRSRCLLVPTAPHSFELLGRDGGEPARFKLGREEAASLLGRAAAQAKEHGLAWPEEPVLLTPSPKLAGLIRKSRALTIAGDIEEGS